MNENYFLESEPVQGKGATCPQCGTHVEPPLRLCGDCHRKQEADDDTDWTEPGPAVYLESRSPSGKGLRVLRFPCETCRRLVAEPVLRCSDCERLQRFDLRVDPTTLWRAIQAEAFMAERSTHDWSGRIENIFRVLDTLRSRILDFQVASHGDALRKEAELCSRNRRE